VSCQYRRGADFERLVRTDLERRGYLAVRAAGSKGAAADGAKIDIIALYPSICDDAFFAGAPLRCQCKDRLLLQCKLSGVVSQVDKNRLIHAAEKYGCAPVIASKTEQGIKYDNLLQRQPTP
jgi:Holliday junction resolvase